MCWADTPRKKVNMGQTILCEVIAAWEETGEQPDFTQYGFASVLDALKAAQDTMFELGTLCNRLREKLDSQQTAQQSVERTVLRCAPDEHDFSKGLECAKCGQSLF